MFNRKKTYSLSLESTSTESVDWEPITEVKVSQLKVTSKFENERIEVTIPVPKGRTAQEIVTYARMFIKEQYDDGVRTSS